MIRSEVVISSRGAQVVAVPEGSGMYTFEALDESGLSLAVYLAHEQARAHRYVESSDVSALADVCGLWESLGLEVPARWRLAIEGD